jgi:hypothetical protein
MRIKRIYLKIKEKLIEKNFRREIIFFFFKYYLFYKKINNKIKKKN